VQPVTVPDPELALLERIKVVCDVKVEVKVALDVGMCLTSLKLPYELKCDASRAH
jgi:hypothetical protein